MDASLQKQNPTTLKRLIGKRQIAAKIQEVAQELERFYFDKHLVLLMVLKGSICLVADLIRRLKIPCDIEMVQCASYGARGVSRGELTIHGLERASLQDRDVLIVDDIFDSGQTLHTLMEAVQKKGACSVKSLVLLDKKVKRSLTLVPDYVLFHIEDAFVVGYGLDYHGEYRNLPFIGALDPELIEEEREKK